MAQKALYKNHQWKVTRDGLSTINAEYFIEAARLLETTERNGETLYDWPVHLAEKEWVDIVAFDRAFRMALKHHANKLGGKKNSMMLLASFGFACRERLKDHIGERRNVLEVITAGHWAKDYPHG